MSALVPLLSLVAPAPCSVLGRVAAPFVGAPVASPLFPSRRAAALLFILGAAQPAAADSSAMYNLGSMNAGSRKLSDAGVEDGELITELLRRTEANRERNAAVVRRTTEANSFTAIDGSVSRRLVTDLDGTNRYLDAKQVRELTQQRRLACAVLRAHGDD